MESEAEGKVIMEIHMQMTGAMQTEFICEVRRDDFAI